MVFCYGSLSWLKREVQSKWRINEWRLSDRKWQLNKPNVPVGIRLWSRLRWPFILSSHYVGCDSVLRPSHSKGSFQVRRNYFISWPEAFYDFILPSMMGVSLHLEITSTSGHYGRTGHGGFVLGRKTIFGQTPVYFLLVSIRKSCRPEGYCVFILLPHVAFLYLKFFISSHPFIARLHFL